MSETKDKQANEKTMPVGYNDAREPIGTESVQGFGEIRCDNSVFREVAGHAATKVKGIASIGSIGGRSNWGLFGREKDSGIEVTTHKEDQRLDENSVSVSINVSIFYGYNIYEVCTELQRRVKEDVESITNYSVNSVNVNVQGLRPEDLEAEETEPGEQQTEGE